MINVVNRKTYRGKCIYVGRPSVLGNPFIIGKDGNRETVIQHYRRWLWNELQKKSEPTFNEIHRLANLAKSGDLVLACWCFPKQCHAEIAKAAIEWINSRFQIKNETIPDDLNETTAEKQCLCCGSYEAIHTPF